MARQTHAKPKECRRPHEQSASLTRSWQEHTPGCCPNRPTDGRFRPRFAQHAVTMGRRCCAGRSPAGKAGTITRPVPPAENRTSPARGRGDRSRGKSASREAIRERSDREIAEHQLRVLPDLRSHRRQRLRRALRIGARVWSRARGCHNRRLGRARPPSPGRCQATRTRVRHGPRPRAARSGHGGGVRRAGGGTRDSAMSHRVSPGGHADWRPLPGQTRTATARRPPST